MELLELLARTRTTEALEHLVERACVSPFTEQVLFCADQLKAWPDRATVLKTLGDFCAKSQHKSRDALLIRALLGEDKFLPQIKPIFDDLFGRCVLTQIEYQPNEDILKWLYNGDLEEWRKSERAVDLCRLPLATRAVARVPSSDVAQKTLQIVRWAISVLLSAEEEQHRDDEDVLELLCPPYLPRFGEVGRHTSEEFRVWHADGRMNNPCWHNQTPALRLAREPDIVKALLRILVEVTGKYRFRHCERLVTALTEFCDKVPDKCVAHLLSTAVDYYGSVSQGVLDKVDLEKMCGVVLSLCRRADSETVATSVRFLDGLATGLDEKTQRLTAQLARAMRQIKGRRFLTNA